MASSGNLALVWDDLKSGIDEIFKMKSVSMVRYMHLYSLVYNYCTYVEHRQTTSRGIDQSYTTGKLVGLELYKNLRSYLKSQVGVLKTRGDNLSGEEMLSYFEKSWAEFRFASTVVSGVCGYLNGHWIKRERDEGRKHVYEVFQLALITWQEYLLKPHARVLNNSILHEIERERRGEVLSTLRLRKIIDCLVELGTASDNSSHLTPNNGVPAPTEQGSALASFGLYSRSPQEAVSLGTAQNADWDNPSRHGTLHGTTPSNIPSSDATSQSMFVPPNDPRLSTYQDYFERIFLSETERFYRLESVHLLQSLSICEYLQRAEMRLNEERVRVQAYLHPSTLPKLIRCTECHLLREHLNRLTSEFVRLVVADLEEDVWRMYRLVGHFPNGVRALVSLLEDHVDSQGSEALRQVASTSIDDSMLYIDAILQVHRKHSRLVAVACGGDPAFVRAVDKGCERFINRNAVTEMAGSSRKSPELLAKYADCLLKKGPKDLQLDDLNESLEQVMNVFKYIEDKDVFQRFYSKTMARRLVFNQSISEDAEALMISKLKETCGFEYTAKLQRMFQDMHGMRDLNSKFGVYVQTHETTHDNLLRGIDFNVLILSSNAWPYQAQPRFSIPPEIEHCHTTFLSFYQEHHTGRKLSWCLQLSRGEVVTNYTKVRYTFQVSTHQAAVLMLYNLALVHTVSSIQSQTSIDLPTLLQVLHILLKAKVLQIVTELTSMDTVSPALTNVTSAEDPIGQLLTEETKLALYMDYKNKRVRVHLNVPLRSEAKQETERTLGNVDMDRKLFVQACIVRIMKTRKVMKHQQLINEMMTHLSSRFKPSIPLIKQCITHLIDREYLRRNNSERDTYEYLA